MDAVSTASLMRIIIYVNKKLHCVFQLIFLVIGTVMEGLEKGQNRLLIRMWQIINIYSLLMFKNLLII